MRKKLGFFIVLLGVCQLVCGQSGVTPGKEYPFQFEALYTGDLYTNAAGGLKRGGGYMGMGSLKIGFDTEKARWWRGGSFHIHGASIHGESLSEKFAGDLQVASNIDAGTHTYLQELWYRQVFGTFSLTVGLQDLNAEFLVSENGAEFINSSFGIPPGISGNVPAPIFPLTGLGAAAKWDINEMFSWQAAVFDGCQDPFEDNPHNLHWRFSKDDGLLGVTEVHARMQIKELEGTYKAGSFYHSGFKDTPAEGEPADYVFRHNYGFYLLADQTVVKNGSGNRKINLFAQAVFSPRDKNTHAHYLGFGANCYGIFNKEGKDILGAAVAYVDQHETSYKHETALELYYKWQFNDNFAVQPDIQYIINPSGTGAPLSNALVGMVRLHVSF